MMQIKEVLYYRREYFIKKVKAPIYNAIVKIGRGTTRLPYRLMLLIEIIRIVVHVAKYPEPTKKNTVWPSTHRLIDVFQKIHDYHTNAARRELIDILGKLITCKNEEDGYYNFLLYFVIDELRELKPDKRGFPMYRYWSGPLDKDNLIESNPKFKERLRERMGKHEAPS